MIESFKHKGLKRLYEDGDPGGLRADMVEKIENILTLLDIAKAPDTLNARVFACTRLKASSGASGASPFARTGELSSGLGMATRRM
jgi:hypothetical protein